MYNTDIEKLAKLIGSKQGAVKLLAYYLDKSISEVRLIEDFGLDDKVLQDLATKYLKGEPINKIAGVEYFYGLRFKINHNVLAPRPDSELVVMQALKNVSSAIRVLDLCCGSGCLGCAIGANANIDLVSSDISDDALALTEYNLKENNVKGKVIKSDLFDNIEGKYDIIVCNPPYISISDFRQLDVGVKEYDPYIALVGGEDGLDFYRRICARFENYLTDKGILIIEFGYDQAQAIQNIFNDYNVEIKKDYGGNDRVAVIKRKLC